jgi:hypothetical protein
VAHSQSELRFEPQKCPPSSSRTTGTDIVIFTLENLRQTCLKIHHASRLLITGQHDRTPVTTKHEKRLYFNPLFAVS